MVAWRRGGEQVRRALPCFESYSSRCDRSGFTFAGDFHFAIIFGGEHKIEFKFKSNNFYINFYYLLSSNLIQ